MKKFLDHGFRYGVFCLSLFILYAALTGFEKPESLSAIVYGFAVVMLSLVLGMLIAGVIGLFSQKK